jgi:acyl carrier protein
MSDGVSMIDSVEISNRERLRNLLLDVLLLESDEFHFDLARADVETWDSLGVVAIGVGLEETFGYHPTQDEAMSITSVPDIIRLLESKGIMFDD